MSPTAVFRVIVGRLKEMYWYACEEYAQWAARYSYAGLVRQLRLRQQARRHECVEVNGVKIRLNPYFSTQMLSVIGSGEYEKSEARIVDSCLRKNDVVMELGTGLGLIATLCAGKIGSECVFTYEANPALEPIIRETFALNNVSPKLNMCVLGEKAGEQTFYVIKNFWGSSTIRRHRDAKAIQVPVKSLNEELHRIKPSFLIVDIEGGEFDLFQGVDLSGIQKIAIEFHERVIGREKTDVVRSLLTNAGFNLSPEISSYSQELYERTRSV